MPGAAPDGPRLLAGAGARAIFRGDDWGNMASFARFLLYILDAIRGVLVAWATPATNEPGLVARLAPAASPEACRDIEANGNDGKPIPYKAVGVHGLMLICQNDSGEVRYIDAGAVSDVPGFYRVWKELGGMGQGLCLPDGSPYDPAE